MSLRREATLVSVDVTGKAVVELDTISQCLKCSRGQGCGAAITGPSTQSGLRLSSLVLCGLLVCEGQKVIVEIDEPGSGWLWAVFGAYGLPLVGLLLATGLANIFTGAQGGSSLPTSSELIIVLSALGGLAGGIFAWRALAPGILMCAERGLCLQSARIVAIRTPAN